MDSQTGSVQDDNLLREAGEGGAGSGVSAVDLGQVGMTPAFSLTALCSSSAVSVEGEMSTLHAGAAQNVAVLHDTPSVSVTELMNSLPVTVGGLTPTSSSQTLQWENLASQNAIITFHTLPFMEGGQEIAITEACMPVNVDLSSADQASLVQSLMAQGIGVKTEDVEKGSSGDGSQLINLGAATVAGRLVNQGLATVSSNQIPEQAGGSEAGTSNMAPVVLATSLPEEANAVFTDDTPIFTRVCTTLNADVMNFVPGSREVLVELLSQEENAHLGIDEQQHFTLEASLTTISRVHNRLKDLLDLPTPTRLSLSPELLPPSTPWSKKVEERGVSCRLLLPFVSSKGRRIKVPSHMPAVMNDNDPFNSDDSDYEVKPPRQRRKGRPRKVVTDITATHRKALQSSSNTEQPGDVPTDVDLNGKEDGSSEMGMDERVEQEESSATNDLDCKSNVENIMDPSERPGVMRTARNMHVTQATRMRRIYEGRIKFKFFCSMCSFKSKRESHYNKHLKLHEGPGVEVHKCTECDFKTIRLSHLRRHELLHKNTLLTCNLCGYMTDTNHMLLKHVKLKHPNGRNCSASQQQLFRCEVCGHSSSNRKYFTRHLMRHARDSNIATVAGMDGFQCTECQRTFQRRVHYERHLRDVHGPQLRPHLCDICGKSFKRSDALQQHKVVHTSQANRTYQFHCTKCSKGFRSQAHLREHLTMHSSERPYLCQYCGSSFKTQSVQRKHILSLHIKPRAHSCGLCTKKFNTPYALRRHNRTHEAEAQKLAAAAQSSVEEAAAQETALLQLGMDTEDPAHLAQVSTEAAVVAVADTGEGLQIQQQALVQDVLATGIEESIEPGDALQTQYIVQSSETASALFYLTSSL